MDTTHSNTRLWPPRAELLWWKVTGLTREPLHALTKRAPVSTFLKDVSYSREEGSSTSGEGQEGHRARREEPTRKRQRLWTLLNPCRKGKNEQQTRFSQHLRVFKGHCLCGRKEDLQAPKCVLYIKILCTCGKVINSVW